MPIYRDNQEVIIKDGHGEPFPATVSHSEEQGHHTFVIAAEKENMQRLEGLRGDISSKIKEEHGIKNNSAITYAERHPEVEPLYEVNLDNQGPGPGKHGEPEHLKDKGRWVGEQQIQSQLGQAQMPETPKQESLDLSEAQMPKIGQDERRQEQMLQQQEQRIKM